MSKTNSMFVPMDLSKPDALAELFSIHRGIFGGHCMTAGPNEGANGAGSGGDGGAGGDGGDAGQGANRGPGSDGTKPISEMTDAEKLEYFEKKANRLQNNLRAYADYDAIKAERDQLKTATQTDQEKAVAQAKAAGEAEAATKWASRVVQAEFKAAFKGAKTAEQIQTLLEPLDLNKFLTEKGEVDTDKVTKYAASFGSSAGQPDMGQGRRSGGNPSKGDAGRAEAEKRFGEKKS